MTTLQEMLTSPLMLRALSTAVLVGVAAPVMGTYLVQRRLALLGDGIGHMALTGVAAGWLVGGALGVTPHDALAVPGAGAAAIIGALLIEMVRSRGRTSGDVALALLFYGGIAGGVVLITLAGGTTANLNSYLFGSIATVTTTDMWLTLALTLVVLGVGLGLRAALFVLAQDEEFARASGLPVTALNMLVAVLAALTVAVSMRVVGILLVSALMIVPVATAQVIARSFRSTMLLAMGIGVLVALGGLTISYLYPLSPGATIVLLALGGYVVVSVLRPVVSRAVSHTPHPDVPDDVAIEEPA